MGILAAASFQATDLQRHSRDVLEAARAPEGALIRDKDGTNFWVVPAGRASRDRYLVEGFSRVLRVLRLAGMPDGARDVALYGDLAWVAVLPVDDQRQFAWEYAAVLQSTPSVGLDAVEDMLYDWQQTARIYSDPALRRSLSESLDSPLANVEL